MRSRMRQAAGLLAVALCTSSVAAQVEETSGTKEAVAEGVFLESVQVHLVNVDVHVQNRQGEPITGLQSEDFEILEDGQPVAITNFYAFEEGAVRGAGTAGAEELPAVENGASETAESVAVASPVREDHRLSLIVYVDNFNIRPFNRNRVFRRVRDFLLEELTADDLTMLVSYDRSLHIRHGFTTESDLIASALFELESFSGHAVGLDSERQELIEAIGEAETEQEVTWRVRQHSEERLNDLKFTIGALREMVDSLAGLPGRKALLYVSDGIPLRPGEDLFYGIHQRFPQSASLSRIHDFDASRQFDSLAAEAASSRVAFYTIDAAGLRPPSSVSVRFMNPTSPGLDTTVDSMYVSNIQTPLRMLADRTGGKAILNTNDVGPALKNVARDFRTYYSLGYLPAHAGDGRFHRIEVRVKRKGAKVRYREGYRDKSTLARMVDGTTATLKHGLERNPIGVVLSFGEASPGDMGHFVVPVFVDVPLGNIVLLPRSELHAGKVSLHFAALDDEGRAAEVKTVNVPIRIPSDEILSAREQSYRYEVKLLLRAGQQRLAVGVRDEIGSETSFVTEVVKVGEA